MLKNELNKQQFSNNIFDRGSPAFKRLGNTSLDGGSCFGLEELDGLELFATVMVN